MCVFRIQKKAGYEICKKKESAILFQKCNFHYRKLLNFGNYTVKGIYFTFRKKLQFFETSMLDVSRFLRKFRVIFTIHKADVHSGRNPCQKKETKSIGMIILFSLAI